MDLFLGILFFFPGFLAIAILAPRYRPIAKVLMAGFLIRAAFAVTDDLVLGLSRGMDGYWWNYWADVWAKQGLNEILSHVETGSELYKVFMALLYYCFGTSPLMVQMVNVFLGTMVILFVWKLACLLGAEDRSAKNIAWLTAFFPTLVMQSGLLLREVAVTLPLIMGVYYLACWHKRRRIRDAVVTGVALLASMAFHSGGFTVLLALATWVAGSWVWALLSGKFQLLVKNTLAFVLVGSAVIFAAGTGWGMNKFSMVEEGGINAITQQQKFFAKGRTAYLQDLHAESLPELLIQSPIRLAYFLFAPFPWMISGVRDTLGFADAFLFMWLIWRIFRVRRVLRENATALIVFAVFASMVFTFSLGVSNYGTAMRHRDKTLPMLIAVASIVMFRPKRVRADSFVPNGQRGMFLQTAPIRHPSESKL